MFVVTVLRSSMGNIVLFCSTELGWWTSCVTFVALQKMRQARDEVVPDEELL